MKKKLSILLCAFAVLFFDSCADLHVDDDTALKMDLPKDFDWKVYAEINKDVASSQIIFDVQGKNKAFADSIENCANLLKNSEELAQKVYQDYLICPMEGWNRKKKCTGIYAYNTNYNKPTVDPATNDTTWQCIIGTSANTESCWRGGWDNSGDNDENLPLFKDSLPTYLETLLAKIPTSIPFVPVRAMCRFIPRDKDANGVLTYLNNFKLDSILVIEHYRYAGFYDGKPYKYCGGHGVEKTPSLADKREDYYDYGKYTFCLDRNDKKVYVAQ